MSKTFELVIKITCYLMFGSLIILFYFKWSDRWAQIWFLCLSVYIPFYVYYAEKKGRILCLGRNWDLNLKENPIVFRFHQVFYMIFAMSIFAIVVTQLTEG